MRAQGPLRKAIGGEERLWIAWWIWGVLTQSAYVGLYIVEDDLRRTGDLGADLLAGFKLLLFCAWATVAWRCSMNVDTSAWTIAARAALLLTVAVTAITL